MPFDRSKKTILYDEFGHRLPSKALQMDIPILFETVPTKLEEEAGRRDIKAMKLVVPGARAPRLFSEAMVLHKDYTFDEIIVHVGTNYLYPLESSAIIISEINTLLDSLRSLFSATVVFSPVLPRVLPAEMLQHNKSKPPTAFSRDMFHKIHHINTNINGPLLWCEEFMDTNPKYLLCSDGVHVGEHGIKALESCLLDHIRTTHKPRPRYLL